MKTTRPQPNTATIQNLKNQGWKIDVIHYRRKSWKDKEEPLIADKTFRGLIKDFPLAYSWDCDVSHFGGATEIILSRGEETIAVRADCYVKDRFCRRLGTKAALDRLKKLHNIEA